MKDKDTALHRASALRLNQDYSSQSRWRVRAILDGGPEAIRALLGDKMANIEAETPYGSVPWPNLVHSGITALAQKLGQVPEARVPPPPNTDSERPRKRAEKRERIVDAYDEYDRMSMQLPQVGRWMPGYGFAVWTISSRTSYDGHVYPCAQLRDPYNAYPGEWGVDQQPDELAICRRIPPLEAKRLYPKYADQIEAAGHSGYSRHSSGGVYLSGSGWDNPRGRGLEVVEYYDTEGTHILLPDIDARVDFHPNPLTTPAFVVAKRFAFNHLVGQYDHGFGLMAALAQFNILYLTAMKDNVFAPTDVTGEVLSGQYKRGRKAVNILAPNTRVDRPQADLPYQSGEFLSRMERNLRNVIRYSQQDDADSPTPWATGKGLEELAQSTNAEVEEYKTVISHALQDLDAKRLEWDEVVSADVKKPLAGVRDGVRYAETYTPSKDIKGDFKTTRRYGFLHGLDDPQLIVAGGQAMQMGLIDTRSLQEKIDGLDDLTVINERIHDDQMRTTLRTAIMQAAGQGDQRALMLAAEALPDGDPLKELAMKYFTAQEPQMSEEEAALAGMAQGGQGEGPPPDITTVLSRLTQGGEAQGGLQTVQQVA